MKNLVISLLAVLSFAACSSKPKEVAAPAPVVPPEIKMAQANVKSIKGKKVSGMFHFTQDTNKVVAEAHVKGLKAGAYTLQVSDITDCGKVSVNKNLRQVGEFVADRKGVVKSNMDLADVSTQDLTGKTLLLQSKSKKAPAIVACGLVETMQ